MNFSAAIQRSFSWPIPSMIIMTMQDGVLAMPLWAGPVLR